MPNWGDVLQQITQTQNRIVNEANNHARLAEQAADIVRRNYLNELHRHTDRNVIAYYSGFLSKPGISHLDINDEDKNGFMMAVHKLDRQKGLDLILHTPGGNIAATHSIVNYLQKMFSYNIRVIVPQIAMSAGTMIACSSRTILMTSHANLGPIDPHIRGIPSYGVIHEFNRACREVKKDINKIQIWAPIISQYKPTFLSQCENSIKWSNDFVREQLQKVMFSDDPKAKEKAGIITKRLSGYKGSTHEKHIHFDECKEIGLKVERVEEDQALQDLVLTVHHCYMHSLMNSQAVKIIENQLGAAFIKQHASNVQ